MITKALIIDEPWLSKILNGEKYWEMRSTKSHFRGEFGLIRKGSGQVIGTANLIGVSGPYCDEELAHHFKHHRVGNDVISKPGYKWRHAWELSEIKTLAKPVSYIHKNGAVTWVELDNQAVQSIEMQQCHEVGNAPLPEDRSVSEVHFQGSVSRSREVIIAEISVVDVIKIADTQNAKIQEDNSKVLVPIAKDGTTFSVASCNKKGIYTVGEKGDELKLRNYGEALAYLREMAKAKWRRPNEAGNWGIVTAVDWVNPT